MRSLEGRSRLELSSFLVRSPPRSKNREEGERNASIVSSV